MENFTQCAKCGTVIKNIIIINNLPYGTECATTILGIKQLPSWFKGGDWDTAKLEHDKHMEQLNNDFERRRAITTKHWDNFIRLSRAMKGARVRGNQWEQNFISSIKTQAGFYTLTSEGCHFDTMEQAENGWKEYMGGFPYLTNDINGIAALSSKQLDILERIESKNA